MTTFREIKIHQAKARLKEPLKTLNVSGYSKVKEAKFDNLAMIRYSMDPMLIIGAYSYVLIDKGLNEGYNTYSYVLIDKGLNEGYNTGDAVAIWEEDKTDESLPPRLIGRGIIARAADNESSVLIREIYSNSRRIEVGHRVSVTHRAQIVK